MPMIHRFTPLFARQQGAALVVSLVILAVVTLLGVTGMQTTNMDLKMAASSRDRNIAFEAAEAALLNIEQELGNFPPQRDELLSTCNGSGCYNRTCTGGLCFDGDFKSTYSEYECQVADQAGTTRRVSFWSDAALDVWNNPTRHLTKQMTSVNAEVKYIIEFLCFVGRDNNTPFSEAEGERNSGAPLFRVTVLAEGNGGRARVALQSTYKVLNGH